MGQVSEGAYHAHYTEVSSPAFPPPTFRGADFWFPLNIATPFAADLSLSILYDIFISATFSVIAILRWVVFVMARDSSLEESYEAHGAAAALGFWRSIWENNRGALLVVFSEFFGSTMDAVVRFLQQGGHGMHAFQVAIL